MTANRRIFLNIVATYGRSLYALAVGLFCSRWTLQVLGAEDYGLYGVVGGMTVFLSFLNSIMSGAVGRFFSVAIGKRFGATTKEAEGIALFECRRWFTTAVVGNTIFPLVVVCIGYPIGVYAIGNIVSVPPDRLSACIWIWRFVCASSLVSMVSVPFNAMYTAHQYIAELTIYSIVSSTFNAVAVYYMLVHPSDWLTRYALWTCLLTIVPSAIIAVRAVFIFPECRILTRYLKCWDSLKKMMTFSGYTLISCFGAIFAVQGCSILINNCFGATVVAGKSIGESLSRHTESLGGCLIGAFSPAIMNAYGAQDISRMNWLIYTTCKIGVLFVLLFAIPLSLEVDEVLRLWLKIPPAYAAGCCLIAMADAVIDKLSVGHLIAINAKGDIGRFQMFVGSAWIFVLPLALVFVFFSGGVYMVMFALVIARVYVVIARVCFARKLLNLSFRYWLHSVVGPLLLTAAIAFAFGFVIIVVLPVSLWRVVLTTIVTDGVLIGFAWCLLLNASERRFLLEKLPLRRSL